MESLDMNKVCRKDVGISLTDEEKRLFSILMEANSELHLGSTLRVAGGWVRDKLLGMHSHDIDIAIDNMTGYEFVEHLPAWLAVKGYSTSNIGKIKANPDKSKHLETATIRILDSSIDFVNLRKEEYTDSSRIPTVEIGTPLEDAYRRDLTINSLFYNINTNMIEDFTMRGIDDLKHRIVRTPLSALETFREDPLRILRAVRFATRYDCRVEESILQATQDPDIELFLSRKVSRERIGIELLKMAQGKGFGRAMHLLEQMNIINCVFNLEGDCTNYMRTQKNRTQEEFSEKLFLITIPIETVPGQTTLDAKYMNAFFSDSSCDNAEYRVPEEEHPLMPMGHRYFSFIRERVLYGIQYVIQNERMADDVWLEFDLHSISESVEEGDIAVLRLACLLYPFNYSFLCGQLAVTCKKHVEMQQAVLSPLIKHFIRENLKLKNSVVDNVCWIVHREHELRPFLQASMQSIPEFSSSEQIILGNLLFSSRELWPLMLRMSAVVMIMNNPGSEESVLNGCRNLLHYINIKEMRELWKLPPIVNGNELNTLGIKKGPGMKEVMDNIRNWMILHPHGSKEECIAEVILKN